MFVRRHKEILFKYYAPPYWRVRDGYLIKPCDSFEYTGVPRVIDAEVEIPEYRKKILQRETNRLKEGNIRRR